MSELKNRYDFVYLFDVQDGNPNGDPDAGNLPRIDPETGHGVVTDVCLKRKLRNYVQIAKQGASGYDIFVKEKAILNNLIAEARNADEVRTKGEGEKAEAARKVMCRRFFDVRTFGAVMSTGENAGQVRGPVQLTFSRSVDPIVPLEHSITRMAVATPAEALKQAGENRTMGRKSTVPYGLYVAKGFVSPSVANGDKGTGFTEEDLGLIWEGLDQMFEHDRSAARGMMSKQRLFIFKHDSQLGNAPAHALFDRIQIRRKDDSKPPRSFSDYEVKVNRDGLPGSVQLIER
ncbi:MAG TPA: type I-C CRISPR-associated protein Cas7/Csd2 [Thermoanaerobaculia bacterium]|nr:type I-C CRISPR-associated protein Cas7/Csd2 [Thermoanaerobaculia bacterium]